MRATMIGWTMLSLAACASQPLDGSDGGSSATDLSRMATVDASSMSCSMIADAAQRYFASHQSCTRDSECTIVHEACGLPATCGAVVALDPASSALTDLVGTWDRNHCQGPCPPCAFLQGEPACVSGRCAIAPQTSLTVGSACSPRNQQPCVAPTQCVQGPFRDGSCTEPHCDQFDHLCRPESDCQRAPQDGVSYCLQRCAPGGGDCRSGYRCCNPRADQPGVGWCFPGTSGPCR